ncbi:hypothetical protein ACFC0S_16885 [Streptomyces sp. NPDC056084]|uniref:hypothetical protein n=1 Tax=unclassified Streptomyces TaxID=2593676 RepID=UPI0035DCEC37
MRPSTWLLLAVLTLLLGHEPWLPTAVFAAIHVVAEQPWALAALAGGILIDRVRRA